MGVLLASSSWAKIRPRGSEAPGAPGELRQLDRLHLPLPPALGLCDFTLGQLLYAKPCRSARPWPPQEKQTAVPPASPPIALTC